MVPALICAGLLLLLNPCVWIWDVLPDFIGALLIIIGMRKIIFLNEQTEAAHRRLWIVAIIGVAKLVVSISLSGASGMIKLLVALIFAVAELVYLVPLVFGVPTLLDDIGTRFLEPGDTSCGDPFRALSRVLSVYTAVRIILSLIPDLFELSGGEEPLGAAADASDLFSDSKSMLYIVVAALCTVGFIIVAVLTLIAFRRYSRGASCLERAVAASDEINRADPAEWYSKKWAAYKIPFIASIVLSIFFYIDGVDCFPKVIAGVIMCALTFMCSTSLIERALSAISSAALAAATVLCARGLSSFYSDFGSEIAIMNSADAKDRYFTLTVLLIIQAALLFVSFVLMMRSVCRLKIRHLDELGGREKLIKSFRVRTVFLSVVYSLSIAAAIASPIFLVAFPEIRVVLTFTGIAAAATSLFTEIDNVY
ncbi:MAG: hypothetical protein IJQ80_02215 [Clostridia bacterium]|nr:hypothetical protein [Clostridia bacterium]